MAFFGSLKKSIRKIDQDMAGLRKIEPMTLFMPEIIDPAPGMEVYEPEEIEEKISKMKAKVKKYRTRATQLKSHAITKRRFYASYFHTVEDFVFDLYDDYKQLEKRAVKYGYIPLVIEPPPEELPKVCTTNCDLDILSNLHHARSQGVLSFTVANSGVTLDEDNKNEQKVEKCITPKLFLKRFISTPKLSVSKTLFDNIPEPCMDEKPKVLTKSVSESDLRRKAKFGDVARRLDF